MKLREAKIFFFTGLQNIIEPRELEAMWRVITDDVLHMDPVDVLMRAEGDVPPSCSGLPRANHCSTSWGRHGFTATPSR